ncbi:MAG TPA: histone deacetylase [Candidatus Acidoferrales bacterium]|jgi:acetoin utilization deacetylase AcuC-like enzyme|nr:histone deacetylase [Candidatus Acidoferrales bacterium]
MLPFKLVYSDGYYLPLGAHVFPAEKYRLIHRRLLETGLAEREDFVEPKPASDDDVLLVHTREYVQKLKTGTLSAMEELQMEVPYSTELVKAFWLAAGGSILAADLALHHGAAFNIGGGFHHACPDHGEGFCVVHDVAVAIKRMHREGRITRAMTVDVDVHDGNGTAAIFPPRNRPGTPLPSAGSIRHDLRRAGAELEPLGASNGELEVFTISLHQAHNYPAYKPPSSIDINLPDGTNDEEYLGWLDQALSSAFRQFEPELLCYIAGADPYKEDQLGGLALTIEGLKKRDELVMRVAKERAVPMMVTFAGGYARRVQDTVMIHCNTVMAAKEVFDARMGK